MEEPDIRVEIRYVLWKFAMINDLLSKVTALKLNLNQTDVNGLSVLINNGSSDITEIAKWVGLSSGAATALVDRLEKSGLARRTNDFKDRRRSIIEATYKGTEIAESSYQHLVTSLNNFFTGLEPTHLVDIKEFLDNINTIFEDHLKFMNKSENTLNT